MIQTEDMLPLLVLAPAADRYNTNPATAGVSMRSFRNAVFLINEGAGGTGTATVTVEGCSAANGTGAEAIPFKYRQSTGSGATLGELTQAAAAGFTTTAGANKVIAIEVDSDDLPPNKPYVRLQLTEVANDPVAAGVTCVLLNPRYSLREGLVSPLA